MGGLGRTAPPLSAPEEEFESDRAGCWGFCPSFSHLAITFVRTGAEIPFFLVI